MRNVFRADLRDMQFVLWEQLLTEQRILCSQVFQDFDRPVIDDILGRARGFACKELGTRYQSSDREGCQLLPDGRVRLPSGYDAAWAAYRDMGWGRIGLPADAGGLGLPYVVTMPVQEMFCGANPGFTTLSGFCPPLFYLLRRFGSPALQALFSDNLAGNRWTACLCMTEPSAGTDVGSITSRATPRDDGTYSIRGTKIFISAGSHELAENIVYVVLARADGSPPGTLGLSCFLVPRYRIGAAGGIAGDNHVRCVRLEEKMGLHGCPTAQLAFGEDGDCIGYLLGERANLGLQQLRLMMNQARIATGIYALGLASSAYLNAAEYAAERIQGCDYRQIFNPRAPRLPIVAHADVRRMLLEMKCKVEGCRALIYRLAFHATQCQIMESGQPHDPSEKQRHEGLVNLLTPIAKAYTSDQAWRIAELAIQVHGGYGYTRDYPVEQYARDVKILSIWEGTNYIQAVDLIRDKLGMGSNPRLLRLYVAEIEAFLADPGTPRDEFHAKLNDAVSCLARTVDDIGGLVRAKKMEVVLFYATRFLGMMATVTIAWLLLEAAVVARRAVAAIAADHPDAAFYRGKILSAQFFFGQFLPTVFADGTLIADGEDSPLSADLAIFLERTTG
jgi:alkylation response protein AidB-like acyl-CoA dehydrogenase